MRKLLTALFLLLASHAQAQDTLGVRLSGVISSIRGADFNSTLDQSITIPPQISTYVILGIGITNCTGSNASAVGGVYDGAGKTGNQIIGAAATYSNSAATDWKTAPLSAYTSTHIITATPLYFSLTTPQGSPVQCDIYLIGGDFS